MTEWKIISQCFAREKASHLFLETFLGKQNQLHQQWVKLRTKGRISIRKHFYYRPTKQFSRICCPASLIDAGKNTKVPFFRLVQTLLPRVIWFISNLIVCGVNYKLCVSFNLWVLLKIFTHPLYKEVQNLKM